MKAGLRMLVGLLLCALVGNGQNVFDPNDSMYTYDASSPAGSPTNPNQPPDNTMAKWIRSFNRNYWDVSKFKCYIYNGMAFRLRFPDNYDPSGNTKYPVLVFFHGGGEIGPITDNENQLYWGAQMFEQRIDAGLWNGFMLFPQETSIGWDDSYFSRINNILDTLQRYDNTDPDRTIAMGLSSGGYGAISYAQLYPQRIANVISSSPAYVSTLNHDLGNFIHIPLWITNGGVDTNPGPSETNNFVSAFRGAGGYCYQTYLADEGHITWSWQWDLINFGNNAILTDWWNKAHKAQPIVFYNNDHFCAGAVNARLGISAGFAAYEWQVDNGGGFTSIPGATTNEYQATQAGKYRVRFRRTATSAWSDWSPNPVAITETTCTTDTLFAERFEESLPYYYAALSYKPYTFDCQNGVITSSTYNITRDGSGREGGRFLLHNTATGGSCSYSPNDEVWHATTQVQVTPNTNYEYVFYLANRSNTNNAQIMPTINGLPVTATPVQVPNNGNNSWTKFSFIWNSGSATSADLALVNKDTATSGNDFALDEISFGYPAGGAAPANKAPVARAGSDTTITLPVNSLVLNGSASSDSDGHIVKYAWTKIGGPAQFRLLKADSAFAPISNLDSGIYTFRLLVTDDKGATGADTVIVTVNPGAVVPPPPPPANKPPVARAGADITIRLPVNYLVLNGSASSDSDGHIVSYAWTKISGPVQYRLLKGDSVFAPLSNLDTGVYTFRLLVTDNNGATGADTIQITVLPGLALPAPPPVVCGPLPAGVFTTDVTDKNWFLNNTFATGSACFIAPDTYMVKGAGDMVKLTDKFRFVYRTFEGNGTITVRVTRQDSVSPLNKAGIMLRESLTSGADYVLLAIGSGNGVTLQTQTHSGLAIDAGNTAGAGSIRAPYYLRLVRTGSAFTAWVSKDSIKWINIGKKNVPAISKKLYVGLAVSSHYNNILSEAVFNGWTITGGKGPDDNDGYGDDKPAKPHPVVFPNPTPGGFTIDFDIKKKQQVWITITSGSDGRISYIEKLDNFEGHYHKNLNTLRLAQGNYAVTVRTEAGVETLILIKQ